MNSEIILKYYWEVFLQHVCEYYPLDKEFIEKYKEEINWEYLSLNKSISWDIHFSHRCW